MGLFDFLKESGEKMTHSQKDAELASERAKAEALTNQVQVLGLKVDELDVHFDDGIVTVKGKTPSQQEREKVVLVLGNTQGVARVDDQLTVEIIEPEATLYTVKSGDSLSKIAKAHYGDAMKYPVIFEANQPMLKDPDKIYPGQVLRIPPLEG
jgi:nucleoid-associated protein YgaU